LKLIKREGGEKRKIVTRRRRTNGSLTPLESTVTKFPFHSLKKLKLQLLPSGSMEHFPLGYKSGEQITQPHKLSDRLFIPNLHSENNLSP
jgi:hypothetical protein